METATLRARHCRRRELSRGHAPASVPQRVALRRFFAPVPRGLSHLPSPFCGLRAERKRSSGAPATTGTGSPESHQCPLSCVMAFSATSAAFLSSSETRGLSSSDFLYAASAPAL